MGSRDGGDVFEPMARTVLGLKISKSAKVEILGELCQLLLDKGWSNPEAMLGEFEGNDLVLGVLRECGVVGECGMEGQVDDVWTLCTETGGHYGDHYDGNGRHWR